MNVRLLSLSLALPLVLLAAPSRADPVAGQTQFKMQCAMCHAVEVGKKGLGPSLAGVVGRKSGSVAGFAYSPAMSGANLKWDRKSLDGYLANPRGFMPSNRMAFAGQQDAKKRTDIIDYLATLK